MSNTKYKYIANSEHKNHICEVLKWSRGKAKANCLDCAIIFIGIARCFRKIKMKEAADEQQHEPIR